MRESKRERDEWLRAGLLMCFSCSGLYCCVALKRQDEHPPAPRLGTRPIRVAGCLSISPDCHIKGCHRYRKQLQYMLLKDNMRVFQYSHFSPPLTLLIQQWLCLAAHQDQICLFYRPASSSSHKPFMAFNMWNQPLFATASLSPAFSFVSEDQERASFAWICQPLGALLSVNASSDLCQSSWAWRCFGPIIAPLYKWRASVFSSGNTLTVDTLRVIIKHEITFCPNEWVIQILNKIGPIM